MFCGKESWIFCQVICRTSAGFVKLQKIVTFCPSTAVSLFLCFIPCEESAGCFPESPHCAPALQCLHTHTHITSGDGVIVLKSSIEGEWPYHSNGLSLLRHSLAKFWEGLGNKWFHSLRQQAYVSPHSTFDLPNWIQMYFSRENSLTRNYDYFFLCQLSTESLLLLLPWTKLILDDVSYYLVK